MQALELPMVEVTNTGTPAAGIAGGAQARVGLGVAASGGGDDGQNSGLEDVSVEGWVDVRRRRVFGVGNASTEGIRVLRLGTGQ